mmetsp:Transcript_25145/g.63299  ORF Transcript_25145/g.63299 Transcript_25145/m.63299 type:complete len:286 (+) Transcript_25145:69-926(+)
MFFCSLWHCWHWHWHCQSGTTQKNFEQGSGTGTATGKLLAQLLLPLALSYSIQKMASGFVRKLIEHPSILPVHLEHSACMYMRPRPRTLILARLLMLLVLVSRAVRGADVLGGLWWPAACAISMHNWGEELWPDALAAPGGAGSDLGRRLLLSHAQWAGRNFFGPSVSHWGKKYSSDARPCENEAARASPRREKLLLMRAQRARQNFLTQRHTWARSFRPMLSSHSQRHCKLERKTFHAVARIGRRTKILGPMTHLSEKVSPAALVQQHYDLEPGWLLSRAQRAK